MAKENTVFLVTINVAPSNVDEFLKHFKPVYEAVIAEPENYLFKVLHEPDNPGQFKFVEGYNASLEWVKEHINGGQVQLKKAYYDPYVAATEHLWLTPRRVDFFTELEGYQYIPQQRE